MLLAAYWLKTKSQSFQKFPLSLKPTEEHRITAGVGINLSKRFTLNIGGMYSPPAKISGSNLGQGISSYETSMSQYSIDMGITYVF